MASLAGVRRRLRGASVAKHDEELRWWLQTWDPVIREGGLFPGDALDYLPEDAVESTYLGRRWQQARAEVRRVVREAGLADERFFAGKVVLDVGPGPLGFPDACPARVAIGVEPLAERFAEHGLLLPDSPALYLSTGAERVPLVSASVDVVLARNSLDHVDDPEQVLAEIRRLLRPGGTVILNFDVGHTPTAMEPHTLTEERVLAGLSGLTIDYRSSADESHGHDGHTVVLRARASG
jgi:SAM-dependent methyltransferase